MTRPRQRWLARIALLAFAVACVGWLVSRDFISRVSTNALDLLPAGAAFPELTLVREIANDAQARVVMIALRDPGSPNEPPREAAATLAQSLRDSGEFDEALSLGETDSAATLARTVFARRMELLLPTWLAQRRAEFAQLSPAPNLTFSDWLALDSAERLQNALSRPDALGWQDVVSNDPLLLTVDLLSRLTSANSEPPVDVALVWTRSKASPLAEAGQAPVTRAIEEAFAQARLARPGLTLQWTGVHRLAKASRDRIQKEMAALNALSVAAVLGVTMLFLRRPWRVFHVLPIVALSLLGAWTATTLVFPQVHILVVVIGALLCGVAVDYGFHLMVPHADGDPAHPIRSVLRPLLASCFTTVLGFSLLLVSELPLLRQMGVFVVSGLLSALIAALLYVTQLGEAALTPRAFASRAVFFPRGRVIVAVIGLACAVALLGASRLTWRDDIRELEVPSPDLHREDDAVRALFNGSAARTLYLSHGNTLAEARDAFERFRQSTINAVEPIQPVSLAEIFPTETDWREAPRTLTELTDFPAAFASTLSERGFDVTTFEPFFSAWDRHVATPMRGDYDSLYRELRPVLQGPLGAALHLADPPYWFLSTADRPLPAVTTGTLAVSQLETLNHLFTRYRTSALTLSLVGAGLLVVAVVLLYRGQSVRILLIPAGACLFAFGALGFAGAPLNLFHLLGAFLGLCLSYDYAIFSAAHRADATTARPAVRLSALTTAASFGVLSFSAIPVISALGSTVTLLVLGALVLVEVLPGGATR